MGRSFPSWPLPPLCSLLSCGVVSPARAEVCDKVLGDWASSSLMHAPLFIYVLRELIAPYNLALVAVALLGFRHGGMRGLALIGTILAGLLSYVSFQEILYPHIVAQIAWEEGCGGHYLANAIVAPLVTVLLLTSLVSSTSRNRKR